MPPVTPSRERGHPCINAAWVLLAVSGIPTERETCIHDCHAANGIDTPSVGVGASRCTPTKWATAIKMEMDRRIHLPQGHWTSGPSLRCLSRAPDDSQERASSPEYEGFRAAAMDDRDGNDTQKSFESSMYFVQRHLEKRETEVVELAHY